MPETTTDFEQLQQALYPLREANRRLYHLAYLLRNHSPVNNLAGDHRQRAEYTRRLAEDIDVLLPAESPGLWVQMYQRPLTLSPEGIDGEQICRVCGCTECDACPEGCSWAESDLCSVCAELQCSKPVAVPVEAQIAAAMERIVARCCVFEETLDPEIKAVVREYQELVMEQSRLLGGAQ